MHKKFKLFKSKSELLEEYLKSNFSTVNRDPFLPHYWTIIEKGFDSRWFLLIVSLVNEKIFISYSVQKSVNEDPEQRSLTLDFRNLKELGNLLKMIFHEQHEGHLKVESQIDSDNKMVEIFMNNQLPEEDLSEILQDIKDLSVVKPQIITGVDKFDGSHHPYYNIMFERPVRVTKFNLQEFSEFFTLLNEAIVRIESEYEVDVEWHHEELNLLIRSNLKTQFI